MSQSARKRRQQERNFNPPQIEPKTDTQAEFLRALANYDCVVGTGPAGTGKTYLASCFSAQLLIKRAVSSIVIARPLVGVGKSSGFLPGTLAKKLEPWARPIISTLQGYMGARRWEQLAPSIEITSLEHVRGLTYDNSVMILDEAQNATEREIKAFITRIGENSIVYLLGDVSQSDLNDDRSGLELCKLAVDQGFVPSAASVEFTSGDVVRSRLCKEWVQAFEKLKGLQ